MVGYVLNQTSASSLSWIGHSQGTIQAFSGLSVNPAVAAKVNLFVALAPVAYVNHQRSVLLSILADLDLPAFFTLFGATGGAGEGAWERPPWLPGPCLPTTPRSIRRGFFVPAVVCATPPPTPE